MKVNRLVPGFLMILALAAVSHAAEPTLTGLTLRMLDDGFDKPLYVTWDATGRTFLVEQPGRIRLLVNGKAVKKPYLDVTDRVFEQNECGFLSIAFHPKFDQNGRLFVDYTRRTAPGRRGKVQTIISEFKADPKADTIDPSTEKVILTIDQPEENHNGGHILFGPDGMLYIASGDGGGGGDGHGKFGNGQNRKTMLGKILRIDVSEEGKYTVPKDNPFVKDDTWLPEIWATGLRNPWRLGFDRKTGVLYAGDVGQGAYEEIDVIVKGGNYGWRIREGMHGFKDKETSPDKLIDPIAEYGRKVGISVTGGYVYRGKAFPEMQGIYFYGDFSSARIWGLVYDEKQNKATWNQELPVTIGKRTGPNQLGISSFGEDKDGELYVCDHGGGRLYQVTPSK